jgi:hypothetical protein
MATYESGQFNLAFTKSKSVIDYFNLMKYCCFLISLLILNFASAKGITKFNQGDKVNVWVLKGIKLYSEPNSKSKPLSTIAYGSVVEILSSETDSLKSFQGSITNDISRVPVMLKGHWVKISFQQKQGYVFDGYLSRMPCLKLSKQGVSEEFETYIKRNYKGYFKKINKKKVEGIDFEENIYYYKGRVLLKDTAGDGCFDTAIYLKDVSYQDARLFEKVYLNGGDAARDIKVEQQKNNLIKISFYSCT